MVYDKINIYLEMVYDKREYQIFSRNGLRQNQHLLEMVYDKINI